jgi:hypothetical protein
MDGMEWNSAATKPLCDFLHVGLAVGVIEVLARGKNLDGLHATAHKSVQNTGMKPFLDEQIG